MPLPPRAPQHPCTITTHGIEAQDPYHWMRAENWDEVLADGSALDSEIRDHVDAENAYSRAVLDNTSELQRDLVAEMRSRVPDCEAEIPERDGPFAYYWRYRAGDEHPVFARVPAEDEYTAREALLKFEVPVTEQILLDLPDEAAQHTYFDIGDLEVSPNHRWLAWSADCVGSEQCTLFIRDLSTGIDLEQCIERVASLSWLNNEWLVYVELDDFHRANRAWRHQLGKDVASNVLVYEETDPAFEVSVGRLRSGEYLEISSARDTEDEIRLLSTSSPLASPLLIQEREPGLEYSVDHLSASASPDGRDRLVILTNEGAATDFKLMQTTLDAPSREHWTELLPHRPGQLLLSFDVFQEWIVWTVRVAGLARICWNEHRACLSEGVRSYIPSENAYAISVEPSPEYISDCVRYSIESPTKPAEIYQLSLADESRQLLQQYTLPGGHDSQHYRCWREFVRSHDGVDVPLTCVAHVKTLNDGTAPGVMEVYGSYGSSLAADFCSNRISLLDRGYVYALAHVRGGQECGRQWYESARGERKTNTFHDVLACADYLRCRNIVSARSLTLLGRSAGGLAVGAALNIAPEKFSAAIADMPFVDVLQTMLDETLPLTPGEWTEWGNPITSRQAYETIAAYSPVDNVSRQAYPAVLVSAALADPRVGYWEPMKWVAQLREHGTGSRPLLLHIHTDAGHFGAVGRFAGLVDLAREYAFILQHAELSDQVATRVESP